MTRIAVIRAAGRTGKVLVEAVVFLMRQFWGQQLSLRTVHWWGLMPVKWLGQESWV